MNYHYQAVLGFFFKFYYISIYLLGGAKKIDLKA